MNDEVAGDQKSITKFPIEATKKKPFQKLRNVSYMNIFDAFRRHCFH